MKIQTGRTYIPWVDLLRIVACFMVLISHSCDAFVGAFDNSFSFHTGVFWGSLVRPCVPLFAMMSGILLFPVTSDLATFYKKKNRENHYPAYLLVCCIAGTFLSLSELCKSKFQCGNRSFQLYGTDDPEENRNSRF